MVNSRVGEATGGEPGGGVACRSSTSTREAQGTHLATLQQPKANGGAGRWRGGSSSVHGGVPGGGGGRGNGGGLNGGPAQGGEDEGGLTWLNLVRAREGGARRHGLNSSDDGSPPGPAPGQNATGGSEEPASPPNRARVWCKTAYWRRLLRWRMKQRHSAMENGEADENGGGHDLKHKRERGRWPP
jgi:hypothetical protein